MSILDKASLIQIPSGYKNGKLYSVKPNPSYGSEQISNGDFSNGSTGWTVSNGTVTDKYNASMTAYQNGIKISTFSLSGTYKLIFDLTITSGNCKFDGGGSNSQTYTTSGRKELTITNPTKFEFNAFNLGWVGTLDNVSVKEVLVADGDFTFSRSSSGTRVNADGYIEEVPWNLVTNSNDLSYLTTSNVIKTTNAITSPIGSNDGISVVNTNNYGNLFKTNVTIKKDSNFTQSVYVKPFSTSFIYMRALSFDNDMFCWFDLENVSVGTDAYNIGSIEQAEDGWVRCSITFTSTTNLTGRLYLYATSADNQTAQTGDSVYYWGLQYNHGSPKPYIKTTNRLDVPRLDYSGGASCASLLLEPQSTNLVNQSETFSDWNTEGGKQVVTQGVLISPDGTLNGNKLETYNTASANQRKLWVAYSVTVGASYTFSVYIKQVSGQINSGFLHITTGANDTKDVSQAYTATDQWQRVSVTTNSAASSQIRFLITGDANSQIYIWGAQVEQQSYATSYIPTSGSTVTRTADVCNNAGTSATFNDSEGVLFAEIAALYDDGTYRQISLTESSGGGDVLTLDYSSTSNQIRSFIRVNGAAQSLTHTLTDETQYNKIAIKYKDTHEIWVNGSKVASSSLTLLPIDINLLTFDNGAGGGDFYGKTKQLMTFNEALSDEELSDLTGQVNLSFNNLANFYNYIIL